MSPCASPTRSSSDEYSEDAYTRIPIVRGTRDGGTARTGRPEPNGPHVLHERRKCMGLDDDDDEEEEEAL